MNKNLFGKMLLACAIAGGSVIAPAPTQAAAGPPSLELPLDKPRQLSVGGGNVDIGGDFTPDSSGQPALGVGKAMGPSIPTSTFFGEKGTLAFTLSYKEARAEHANDGRYIVTINMEGRGFFGFYMIGTDRRLNMSFKQLGESTAVLTPEALKPNQSYRVAATWDGQVVTYYLDGKLLGEMKQTFPATFPDYSRLAIGPFKNGYNDTPPWGEDDVFLRNLKVWRQPLSATEIALDAGVDVVSAQTRYPSFLSIPKTAAPAMNGKLDDPAWKNAASFVALNDQTTAEKSLSYPDNRPLLSHDGQNLYVGFETLFPTGARLLPGDKRGAVEGDVWNDESFEFYLDVAGKLYRFGGNAAGGYCEMVDNNAAWDGQWQYASTLEFRIDNRYHWQGEIKIPFATLGITKLDQPITLNFCRTWRCFDDIGMTSLQHATQNYGDRTRFVKVALAANAEGGVTSGSTDPSFGEFKHKLALHSEKGGDFTYTVKALNATGDGPAVFEKKVNVSPGGTAELPVTANITAASAQDLLFQLNGPGGELLMRQLVPMRLSEDYLEVTPVFGSQHIQIKPRYATLEAKYPGVAPVARVLGPDGKLLQQVAVKSDAIQRIPFAANNAVGEYTVELVTGEGQETHVYTSKKIQYTGNAPWEHLPKYPSIVPAPFEPLRVNSAQNKIDLTVWGRKYHFANALLPSTITAQGRGLLSAPAQLKIGGVAVAPTKLTARSKAPVRFEFDAARADANYDLNQKAWVEYDGVFYNTIELKAKKALGAVTVSVPVPAKYAKFLHATRAGFGGGGRVNMWLDKNHELPYYPSVWFGDEEGGMAWFAESNSTWTTKDQNPIKVIREGETTRLEVTFADGVPAGQSISFEFGLLATPVRPLPKNYPLDLFGDNYMVHLNTPGQRPVIYSGSASMEGAGFFDLPIGEKTAEGDRWLHENLNHFDKNNSIFAPYMASMIIPAEYPEVSSRLAEWQLVPSNHLSYTRDGVTRPWYWTCSASEAGDFYAWKFDQLLDRVKLRGIYLDFGAAALCNNPLHGCNNRFSLLGQRRLYQRMAESFVKHGVKDYAIIVHNSESVQWPTFTHATNFLNGEGLRQMSSTVFHNGKDLQDTYTRLDWAMEQSSLPFGVTNSVYVPTDPLLKEFGGGVEDDELYRFRMTKAALAGMLIHNTLPNPSRMHYGWFDKISRIYDSFGVPTAKFEPYWKNSDKVKVLKGKDIYVSYYRSSTKPEVLALISHMANEHLDQDVEVQFDPAALGLKSFTKATEQLTAPDPAYDRLYQEPNRLRMPIKLGDFGVENVELKNNKVSFKLKFHSVAVVKLEGVR